VKKDDNKEIYDKLNKLENSRTKEFKNLKPKSKENENNDLSNENRKDVRSHSNELKNKNNKNFEKIKKDLMTSKIKNIIIDKKINRSEESLNKNKKFDYNLEAARSQIEYRVYVENKEK